MILRYMDDCRLPCSCRAALWLLIVAVFFVPAAQVMAQEGVPVHLEPRHRLVFNRLPVRILDVQIQPGDTTLYHTHSSAILYVTIGVSPTNQQTLGGDWGSVNLSSPPRGEPGSFMAVTSYAERELTHRVTNVGDSLFRLIGIANYGPGVQGDRAAVSEEIPGGVVEIDNPWHRAWRHVLEPGASTPSHTSSTAMVGLQVTPGQVEVTTGTSARGVLAEPGAWFFSQPGSEYVIRNTGSERIEVVIVQVR